MKRISVLLLALLITSFVKSAPALRMPYTVHQPDGTQLTISQFGDEHHHWLATTDGTLVVENGGGYYVARVTDNGELEATPMLAHESTQRSSEEQALVSRQADRRTMFFEQGAQSRRRAMPIDPSGGYLPHKGRVRVLCILAQYQDVKFTVNQPKTAFDQMLNSDTQADLGNYNSVIYSSVRRYFMASSNNQFEPQFDIVGPVTLPRNMASYGGANITEGEANFKLFCKDALDQVKADKLVGDWSVYDNDGDKEVELICIIFAGYGQNQGGSASTIWPKASYLNYAIDDKYRANYFNCSCELYHPAEEFSGYINGTGVFIHEMSHCMGLPDLYATVPSAYVNNQSMESWDIMDGGGYCNYGYTPSLYTAWEQEVMGWTTIETIANGVQQISLTPLAEGGKAYKIVNPDDSRDYIVLENVQQSGFNERARGHGLLVYHVAYPRSIIHMDDFPNNLPGRPAVALVPAGGTLICNNLTESIYTSDQWNASIAASAFPGTMGINRLSDDMALPNYCFYSGVTDTKPVGFTLTDITEATDGTGMISLTVSRSESTEPSVIHEVKSPETLCGQPVYNLAGQRIANPTNGLYIVNGRLVVVTTK